MATAEVSMEVAHSQTALQIRAQVNLIQEVMQAVMKKDVHYGTIPGCKQPSLYKPGSEKLLSTFRIAIEPIVEDLSDGDTAHYRVITRATSMNNGAFLGAGVGEASSNEDKYKWRECVCMEEYDATPEDRRRAKYKKGRDKSYYVVHQVRTEMADIANTVLKMAKKRSQIDVTLTVTAASDIFAQDIEDLPEEMRDSVLQEDAPEVTPLPTEIKPKAVQPPPPPPRVQEQRVQEQPKPRPVVQAPRPAAVKVISEAQARRFYAIWKGAGKTAEEVKNHLRETLGIEDDRQIPWNRYEEICGWAEARF